jgi:hypothetical protein
MLVGLTSVPLTITAAKSDASKRSIRPSTWETVGFVWNKGVGGSSLSSQGTAAHLRGAASPARQHAAQPVNLCRGSTPRTLALTL